MLVFCSKLLSFCILSYPKIRLNPEVLPKFDNFMWCLKLQHLILHKTSFRLNSIFSFPPIDFKHFFAIFLINFIKFNFFYFIATFKTSKYLSIILVVKFITLFSFFLMSNASGSLHYIMELLFMLGSGRLDLMALWSLVI